MIDLNHITRECRCGGVAEAIESTEASGILGMTAREVTATMRCTRCQRTFHARIGRLEEWGNHRSQEIDFFVRRKAWARELLAEQGLDKPGQQTEGEFEGQRFTVRIGPRLGVRIRELQQL